MFDAEAFSRMAPEWARRLHYHPELGSTNDEALRLCRGGAPDRTVVLADHQTAGRGRRGAAWTCGPGGGLLFSLILKPDCAKKHWSRLALAAGLGIATVLREQWSLAAGIKWPNDILIGGKKCCGILVETSGGHAVIGVGVNVAACPQNDESVALAELASAPVPREALLAGLLGSIHSQAVVSPSGFARQLEKLREFCCLSGKEITFLSGGKECRGTCRGIGGSGQLLVETDAGLTDVFQAERVRLA